MRLRWNHAIAEKPAMLQSNGSKRTPITISSMFSFTQVLTCRIKASGVAIEDLKEKLSSLDKMVVSQNNKLPKNKQSMVTNLVTLSSTPEKLTKAST